MNGGIHSNLYIILIFLDTQFYYVFRHMVCLCTNVSRKKLKQHI
jgi:ribosome biogenesis protein Nip4